MKNTIVDLARPEIIAMQAYRSARSEGLTGSIFLDANENPWDETLYNRYPEPQPQALLMQLSALYGVKTERMLITRGSDEGIDLLVRLFCKEGQDQILICPPTYGMYTVAANIQGVGVVEIPLIKEKGFSLDVKNIVSAWQPRIKLIFLCSPNNPTGNVLAKEDIISLCEALHNKAIIIVDEAYIEFSETKSLIQAVENYSNLVVLRTLSKAYGLAGIRCGVTVANNNIIELLKKIIAPYPIPRPVVDIACQNLQSNMSKNRVEIILKERERVFQFLANLSWVKKVWVSYANFLLFEADDAKKIFQFCLKNGIVLRNRSNDFNLKNCIRITIGSISENTILMEVLNRV